jgi:acetylornithine deacetylase
MRTLPNASAEALYAEIGRFAKTLELEMKAIDPVAAIELEWVANSEGLNATEHDAIVKLAMKLVRATTVGKVSYGTEAGLFASAGIPSVVIGPGDIAEAHRPNEFVDLDQLAQCEAFLNSLAVDHALVS